MIVIGFAEQKAGAKPRLCRQRWLYCNFIAQASKRDKATAKVKPIVSASKKVA
jgi:hypothetical protein